MSSTAVPVSHGSLQCFTLFTSLPFEIRFIIWHLSLEPRIVELLAWSDLNTKLYSHTKLPGTLQACRESRQAVEALYPLCFGSFLKPENVRFNFELDTLYIGTILGDIGLHLLLGVWKEIELSRLKYLALGEDYLDEFKLGSIDLRRAVKRMKNIKVLLIACDDYTKNPLSGQHIRFDTEDKVDDAYREWPSTLDPLPYVEEYHSDWIPSGSVKLTAVYGWRPRRST